MKGLDSIFTANAYNLLHKKYIEVIRIYDITVQISDSLNRNDVVAAEMFLNMRRDVIVAAATVDEELTVMISSMPEEWQGRMLQLISAGWKDLIISDAAESKVGEEWERVQRQLQKSIELDKEFTAKVGGKNSYYAQKEKGLL